MTTPRLGVRICGLTIILVEIDDLVHETEGDITNIRLRPPLLSAVEPDDSLFQAGGIRGDHRGIGGRKIERVRDSQTQNAASVL